MSENNTTEATDVETVNAEAPQAVGLNVQDLALAVRVIDLAAERGAFKGNDLSTVGGLRDRLATFLRASLPAKTDETPQTETPAASE